jgi:hypothetical protein
MGGADQAQHQPPVPLIKGFNPHRHSDHCGMGEKKRKGKRLLPRGSEPVSQPSRSEEPAQKSQERGHAQDSEISQKPHHAVVCNFSNRYPKASESSTEQRMEPECL